MIQIPAKFATDIKQSNTTIYPLVKIGDEIFISQVKESFDGQMYEDHNLKVSNIKESIDFESRNFKISNVSITLSNYVDLSDRLSSIDLMNLPIAIYWKTQSCTTIDDCLKVYEANVRRFDHDDKKITIKLEDKTQEKFKKEVPIANLGETQFVYSDKYVNKYIPITYGFHDYAPAVMWKTSAESPNFDVICDDIYNIYNSGKRTGIQTTILTDTLTPLRAYKGLYVDIYKTVQFNSEFLNPGEYAVQECYDVDEIGAINCILNFDAGVPQNPFANNEFQAEFKRYPTGIDFISASNSQAFGDTLQSGGNITFNWQNSASNPPMTMSNPKASFDRYDNIFGLTAQETNTVIPNVDDDGVTIETEEIPDIQNEYETWREANVGAYRDVTNGAPYDLHADGAEVSRPIVLNYGDASSNPTLGGINVSGDIFNITNAKRLNGVKFVGENGNDSILYDYGFVSVGNPHPDSHFSDSIGTDWIGWEDQYPSNSDIADYPHIFTWGGSSGLMSNLVNSHIMGDYYNGTEWTLTPLYEYVSPSPYSFIEGLNSDAIEAYEAMSNMGMVTDSTAAEIKSYDNEIDYHFDDFWGGNSQYNSLIMNPSPLPRIKYMHAANNFAFIQLPSAEKIIERLEDLRIIPKYGTSNTYADGVTVADYGNWDETYNDNFGSFFADTWSRQCQYSSKDMGRIVAPFGSGWNHAYANVGVYTGKKNIGSTYFQPGNYQMTNTEYMEHRHKWRVIGTENHITKYSRFGDGDYKLSYLAANPGSNNVEYDAPFIEFGGGGASFNWYDKSADECEYDSSGNPVLTSPSFTDTGTNMLVQHKINNITPEGNIIWTFGIKTRTRDGVDNNYNNVIRYITVTYSPTQMNYDSMTWHGHANRSDEGNYTTDQVPFSFDSPYVGNEQGYTQNTPIDPVGHQYGLPVKASLVTGERGHYALTELFDMREFPLIIPFERTNDATCIDYENDTDARFVSPEYNCYWNGKGFNPSELGGNAGAHAGCNETNMPTSSYYHDGGQHRWFAIGLKDLGQLTKPGLIQSCFGGYRASDGSDEIAFGTIKPSGGDVVGIATSGDFVKLHSNLPDLNVGSSLGIKFKLPDLELEDNIDLAHHAFWKRKFNMIRSEEDDVTDTDYSKNYLVIAAAATEDRRGSSSSIALDPAIIVEQVGGDVLRTCTSVFSENLLSLGGQTLKFSNVGDDDPEDIGTIHDYPSIMGDNKMSLFDGTGGNATTATGMLHNSIYDVWGNPNDFNSFCALFMLYKSNADTEADMDAFYKIRLFDNYIKHVLDFENLTSSDFYLQTNGRQDSSANSIEKPGSVIKDLLITELNLSPEDINPGISDSSGIKLAFSVKDKIDSKKLIEEICSNTNIFPKIDGNNILNLFSISDVYDGSEVKEIIKYDRILSYKFTRTKLDDVNSKVMVKYDLDYATDEFRRNTGWFSAKDFLSDGDLTDAWVNPAYDDLGYRTSFFNLTSDESDSELIFESRFIRDRLSAEKLQEFLAMWYCNQHTIIDLTLDISYIHLEVGDVIRFDQLINGIKAYGEDYTNTNFRNGQVIYPYFTITEVSKKTNKISIKCTQLHRLSRDLNFNFTLGDVTRNGVIDENDLSLIEAYVTDGDESFTREQIKSMDVNQSNNVNYEDYLYLKNDLGI